MHFIALLALTASPVLKGMDKTVTLGKLSIRLKQTVSQGAVHCEIQTSFAGAPVRLRAADYEAGAEFNGCFELPAAQKSPGYFMLREMIHDTPHTVLISENGRVLDVDDLLVHGGRWDMVAAD